MYIDCPRGNEPRAFKAIRDMFGSVFYCDYHVEHGKSKVLNLYIAFLVNISRGYYLFFSLAGVAFI